MTTFADRLHDLLVAMVQKQDISDVLACADGIRDHIILAMDKPVLTVSDMQDIQASITNMCLTLPDHDDEEIVESMQVTAQRELDSDRAISSRF